MAGAAQLQETAAAPREDPDPVEVSLVTPDPVEVSLVTPDAEAHRAELEAITGNPEVMRWVANGRTWDERKLLAFFGYCSEEEGQDDDVRKNYYSVVAEAGRCVGLVGIHPVTYDRRKRGMPFLTVFLAPSVAGRGAGIKIIAEALAAYWRRHPDETITVDTREDNRPMLRIAEKMGFKKAGMYKVAGRRYRRFVATRR